MDLRRIGRDPVDRGRHPVDAWRLVETSLELGDLGVSETLFTVANGYLGMRGNPEEGREAHAHGTFVNGFHETWPIKHAESAFGFARTGQTLVNVPDTKVMKIYVDDEPLIIGTADLEHYERVLDLADGVLRRELLWRTPSGKRVLVRSSRMVSFTQRHLAVMTMEVTMLSGSGPVVISSQILNRQDGEDEYHVTAAAMGAGVDPRKAARFDERVLLPRTNGVDSGRMLLGYQCANSRMTLAVAADHILRTDNDFECTASTDDDLGKTVYRVDAIEGRPVALEKLVAYHTSKGVPVRELADRCHRTLDRATRTGAEGAHREQRAWLDAYWADTDVHRHRPAGGPAGDPVQPLPARPGRRPRRPAGRPREGGDRLGYEGHYFWDTEVYVTPFLSYTCPELARNTLHFRRRMLPAARERARELAQQGALFPWRTINGEEASAYYAAGTAQYHIDADIAFALTTYVDVTGDTGFLVRDGIDVLVETARMWSDLGFWRSNGERSFHIHGVTGPDEYTTVVNNNLFTNVMARYNLERAARAVRDIKATDPQAYDRVVHRLHLDESEVVEWEDCAKGMTIPFDATLGIHPQDEHFLDREVWDLSSTPDCSARSCSTTTRSSSTASRCSSRPTSSSRSSSRATASRSRRSEANFEYYDPITTGDSTLSGVVQSIVAAEVGYHEMALDYFLRSLYVDLVDLHDNTVDGLHVASAGGVWSALVHGFAGLRTHEGALTFDPRLPDEWPELTFRLRWRGTRLVTRLTADEIAFRVDDPGAPPEAGVPVTVRGDCVVVTQHEEVRVPLADQGPRIDGRLSSHPRVGARREDGTYITSGVPDPSVHLDAGLRETLLG